MRALKGIKTEDIVFLDIETVRRCEDLIEGTPDFYAWQDKLGRRADSQNIDIFEDYKKRSSFFPEFSKVVCISVGRVIKNKIIIKTYQYEDEFKMLDFFNKDLEKVYRHNPNTRICGQSIKAFDIPFLFKRSLSNGIIPASLIDVGGMKSWDISALDIRDLWRGTGYYNSSLVSMCLSLGVEYPELPIKDNDISNSYYNELFNLLDNIVASCELKLVALINCYRKMTFDNIVNDVEIQEVVEPEPETIIQRIASTGKITDEDFKELLSEASKLEYKEKEIFINIIKASLSRTGGVLDEEMELELIKV